MIIVVGYLVGKVGLFVLYLVVCVVWMYKMLFIVVIIVCRYWLILLFVCVDVEYEFWFE